MSEMMTRCLTYYLEHKRLERLGDLVRELRDIQTKLVVVMRVDGSVDVEVLHTGDDPEGDVLCYENLTVDDYGVLHGLSQFEGLYNLGELGYTWGQKLEHRP